MGQQETKQLLKTMQSKQWNQISQKYDPMLILYGEIAIYSNRENKLICLGCRVFQCEQDFNKSLQQTMRIQQLNDIPGIVKLIELNQFKEDHLCSQFFKLVTLFEYYENSLGIELEQAKVSYSKREIIDFLQQIVHTLLELENQSVFHGDLRPSNILITKQKEYKLKIPEQDQFQKLIAQQDYKYCYLSPEQLSYWHKKQYRPIQEQKNEIFTLGLVALQMGTLENIPVIYNYANGIINEEALNRYLKIFRENYGHQLEELISSMLMIKKDDRPSLSQIYENLMLKQEKLYSQQENMESSQFSTKKEMPYEYSSRKQGCPSRSQLNNPLSQLLMSGTGIDLQDSVDKVVINEIIDLKETNLSQQVKSLQTTNRNLKEVSNINSQRQKQISNHKNSRQRNPSVSSLKVKRFSSPSRFQSGKRPNVK